MKKKIYRVLVEWSDGADVCIEAGSEAEARAKAVKLMEQGRASYELDQSNASSYSASDAQEVEAPDSVDKKNAGENAEAYAELIDEDMTPEQVAGASSAEEARQFAIDWQTWQAEQSLSYGELAEWQAVFAKLAERFGLVEEFKENGII